MSTELDTYTEENQVNNSTYIDEMVKALEAYPPLLDVKHLMKIFMIGENVAYDEMKSGKFPVMRVGRQLRVAKPLLAKYIIESSCGTE